MLSNNTLFGQAFSYSTTYTCGKAVVSFTSQPSSGTHVWYSNGQAFSNLPNPVKEFSSGGTFQIIHLRNGMSASKSLVIDLTNIGTANTSTGSNSVPILANGGTISDKHFTVSGQLILEKDLIFQNCTFAMGAGSEILIAQSRKITTNNTTFKGCVQMWKGIRASIGNSISLSFTEISDAEYGLRLTFLHGEFSVQNSRFINCLVGIIHFPEFTPIGTAQIGIISQSSAFVRNVFETQGTLLPNYTGQTTASDLATAGITVPDMTPSGIVLLNVRYFRIGSLDGDANAQWGNRNIFRNLNYGVYSMETNLDIASSRFETISGQAVVANSQNTIGKLRFNMTGFGKSYVEPTFQDCRIAVTSNNMIGSITDCKMIRMRMGIIFESSMSRNLKIQRNYIKMGNPILPDLSNLPTLNAIVGFHFNLATNNNMNPIDISNNEIQYEGAPDAVDFTLATNLSNYLASGNFGQQVGIATESPSFVTNTVQNISKNTINMNTGRIGISNLGSKNTFIFDNDVWLNSTATNFQGMALLRADGSKVKMNRIHGSGADATILPTYRNGGIYVKNSPGFIFDCNQLLGSMNRGVTFNSTSPSKDNFNTTTFEAPAMVDGLVVESGASIDAQVNRGTIFNISSSTTDANNLGLAIASKFTVDQSQNAAFMPTPVMPATGWFFNETNTGSTQTGCVTPLVGGGNDGFITDLDISISKNQLSFPQNEANHKWLIDEYLLSKLRANPNLISTQSDIQAYYQAKTNSPLMGLLAVQDAISNINTAVSPSQWASIEQSQQQMQAKWNDLAAIHANIDSFGTNAVPNAVIAQRDQLMLDLDNIEVSFSSNWSNIFASLNTRLSEIKTQNSLVSPSCVQESNQKAYNELAFSVYFQTARNFTQTQINQLFAIASQCYDDAGPAVLSARLMLRSLRDRTFNFTENCGNAPQPFVKNTGSSQQIEALSIWPNPSSDQINIHRKSANGAVEIRIFDLNGRLCKKLILADGQSDLELSAGDFAAGQYFVHSVGDFGSSVQKLIILH